MLISSKWSEMSNGQQSCYSQYPICLYNSDRYVYVIVNGMSMCFVLITAYIVYMCGTPYLVNVFGTIGFNYLIYFYYVITYNKHNYSFNLFS